MQNRLNHRSETLDHHYGHYRVSVFVQSICSIEQVGLQPLFLIYTT